MDDILETLLMNITYQGAFSTMPPRLVMNKFDMTIIRPMCLVHEADLLELAGTWQEYSANAITHENKTTPYKGQLLIIFVSCSFKCPYQANVIKMLETTNNEIA